MIKMGLKDFQALFGVYQLIFPHLEKSEYHLDYGCGNSSFVMLYGLRNKSVRITGYDPSEEMIEDVDKFSRGRSFRSRLNFTSFKGDLGEFDSITCFFVLHHAVIRNTLLDLRRLLNRNGVLVVLDYDMKGVSQEDFQRAFTNHSETQEIKRLGFNEAYEIHTRHDPEEVKMIGGSLGFKEIEFHPDLVSGKYYLWIAQKHDR